LMEAFCLVKQPGYRVVRVPAVVSGVEIGGDILDVQAEAQSQERRGLLRDFFKGKRIIAGGDDATGGDAEAR